MSKKEIAHMKFMEAAKNWVHVNGGNVVLTGETRILHENSSKFRIEITAVGKPPTNGDKNEN